MAMTLLNKYQKDKDIFKKDVKKIQKESAFVLNEPEPDVKTKDKYDNPIEEAKRKPGLPKSGMTKTGIDPNMTMAERHRAVQEMRERRLAERDLQ